MTRPRLEDAVIETRTIGPDGECVTTRERVRRRALSPAIKKLPAVLHLAAQDLAGLYEMVKGGGIGGAGAPVKVDGGRGPSEGRQSGMVGAVKRLDAVLASIGPDRVILDRHGTSITARNLVILTAVGGASLPRIFDLLDVRRNGPREDRLKEALDRGLTRVAIALGHMRVSEDVHRR